MKQRCLQALEGFNIDPSGFSWGAAAKSCTKRTCWVTVLSGTLVLLAHWSLKHQIWANKFSQRAEHSADILGGCAYIKPAADVLQNTRFRLTVWRADAGVGQEGWKASLSSALLKGMWSHALHPKCQTHQPVQLSLGSAAHDTFVPAPNLRVALWPYIRVHTVPTRTHSGSRPAVHGIFGCALTDIAGYKCVSSRSGSFHCVCAACFSAEIFNGSSLSQITSFWQWDKKNLAQLFLKPRLD